MIEKHVNWTCTTSIILYNEVYCYHASMVKNRQIWHVVVESFRSQSGETSSRDEQIGLEETWSNENTPDYGRKSYDFELEEK